MNWNPPHPAYDRLVSALIAEVGTAYIVGGAVRDTLLDRIDSIVDLDIVLEERSIPVARRVADKLGWAFYAMDTGRDVARLVMSTGQGGSLVCDIAGTRGATIEDDLAARDFTVNAMAVALRPASDPVLLDPFGGQKDLAAKLLRRVSAMSLSEDSIRLLRAVRLMVEFDLAIDPATYAQLERLSDTVRLGSAERARDELWKMLSSDRPRAAIELLDSYGLLRHVLPEVAATKGVSQTAPHYQDVYDHTLASVEWAASLRDWILGIPVRNPDMGRPELVAMLAPHRFALRRHFSQDAAAGHSRADWLVWHALLHDIGKPATVSVEPAETAAIPAEAELAPDGSVPSLEARAGSNALPPMRITFIGHEAVGADLATERLTHLRFSKHETAMCAAVVAAHMRPHSLHNSFPDGELSRRAVYRFFRDTGGKQFGRGLGVDTVILALADFLGIYRTLPADWPVYLAHMDQLLTDYFAADAQQSTRVEPLLNGHQLKSLLGIQEGLRVGEILEQLLESQAAGEVNTLDEAVNLARKLHRDEIGSE